MTTTVKTATDARQGENSRRMPIVLGVSVLLILIGFSLVYGYSVMFPTHH